MFRLSTGSAQEQKETYRHMRSMLEVVKWIVVIHFGNFFNIFSQLVDYLVLKHDRLRIALLAVAFEDRQLDDLLHFG